jgi:hypothetical protein
VGGEVVAKMVESRPSRERGVGPPGAHEVKDEFGAEEKAVPEVSREVGVGGGEDGDELYRYGTCYYDTVLGIIWYARYISWIRKFTGNTSSEVS